MVTPLSNHLSAFKPRQKANRNNTMHSFLFLLTLVNCAKSNKHPKYGKARSNSKSKKSSQ